MMPFINPEDEVMTLDPSYPSNFLNAEIIYGKTVLFQSMKRKVIALMFKSLRSD